MVIIFIMIAVLVITILAKKLTKPIILLNQLAGNATEGDFSIRVDESSQNELGMLSKSFNAMIAKISGILNKLDVEKRDIIEIILNEYKTEDFSKLKDITVFNLPVFKEKGYTAMKILKNVFGGNKQNFIDLMKQIEEVLY